MAAVGLFLMRRLLPYFACSLVLFGVLSPVAAQVTILHSFAGGPTDGKNPSGSPTLLGSTLYGMTSSGGESGPGTVFRINADGTGFALLHSFASGLNDGSTPNGSLAVSGTTLYGLTQFGGSATSRGTAFSINADGTGFALIRRFLGGAADGENPLGTLAVTGPTLYGMTFQGGTSNLGTIFKVNTDGTGFGVLHSFSNSPTDAFGATFSAPVLSGTTVYGITSEGGTAGEGTVFRMNTDGTGFALLHSFVPATGDGWDAVGTPVLSGSSLYGMTRQGGGAAGTIFKVNTDGTGYTRLHSFAGSSSGDGANPVLDLLLVGSTLYGTTPIGGTADLGTLFKINTDGTGYQVLYSFTGGPNDPANPGGLTLAGSTLYGLSGAGGANNLGTIFSFPISVPEPSSFLLAASGGAALFVRRRLALGFRLQ